MEPVFNNSAAYHPGLLVELLKESYKNIPSTKDSWMDNIRGFDAQVSAHPQWIGKYVFITTFQGKPIGFVSFDPRKKPLA
ncbi:hypothetical protein HGB07_08050, partial [Candidatus Roizmanbacteria bacterium]|nr:hypothetical protein [Candidatus Roizmanbacteria bacterium]